MRFTEACLLKTENNMTTLSEPLVTPKYGKWRQLVLGLICMAAISSPQYVWTLLTKPLAAKLGVGLPELQVTFSLLIILQTFFSPFQGRLVEKFGPRRLIAIGTVMAGMSWVLSAQVNGLATLWLVYGCMGGLGTGIVYIGVVGLMVKWFPQQRGFAAGAVAAGYGMGAIITTFPISLSLTTNGLEHTMTTFGILFALVGFLASQGLKLPPPAVSQPVSQTVVQSSRSFTSREMLRQPLFWLMFVMMAMMSTSGLMVTSQMAVFAEDFGISQAVVFGMAALPLALTIDRFTNGLTRPLFGFISDRFGREQTMFIAFALEGSDDALAGVPGRSAAVCPALRGGVLWLGRSSRSSRRRSPIRSAASMPPATMAGCIFRRASGQSLAVRWRHCSISTLTAGMWSSAARLALILSPPPSRCGC